METCPKCGKPVDASAASCGFCGVILAKARAKAQTPGPLKPRPTPDPPGSPVVLTREDKGASPSTALLKIIAAGGIAAVALFFLSRWPDKSNQPPITEPVTEVQAFPSNPVALPALLPPDPGQTGLSAEDVTFLNALSSRLQASADAPPTPSELQRLEAIFAGSSHDLRLKDFVFAAWLRRAAYDARSGAAPLVYASVDKLKALDPRQPLIYEIEASVRARQGDWAGAAEAARRYDSVAGEGDLGMSFTLAAALFRLDRRAEALAILDRPAFTPCATTGPSAADRNVCESARQMREALVGAPATEPGRTRAALKVDASKQQIQSERFDIRFDGESQSGVARDVLFVLDRAYVRLADIYYERPTRKIPVVLHSGQDYYTATGAPFWSGGVYSSHDGAIQIPVRGLPSTLPREMEDVLVHELSHAFVDEMSGGFAGRDTQEGLAQYMEGKRIEEELGPAELKRLANSGRQSVMSFYMLSLAVWQQIVQSRGQGMVNELLKAMKTTGSEDAAFEKVFGQSGRDMRTDVLNTFWRRYS